MAAPRSAQAYPILILNEPADAASVSRSDTTNMSFTTTATSMLSPAHFRGLGAIIQGWIPQDNSAMVPHRPQAQSSTSQQPISRKRKRGASSATQGMPSQPPKVSSVEPRQYGMRNRAAKSYAEIDSDDELINESDSGSDSEYDIAPQKV